MKTKCKRLLPEAKKVVESLEKQGRIQKIQIDGAKKCLGMTGIFGPIVKYHSKDRQKLFKKSKKGRGGGEGAWPPSKSVHDKSLFSDERWRKNVKSRK